MLHRFLLAVWSRLPVWLQDRLANLLFPRLNVGVVAIIMRHGTHVLLARHTYKRTPWRLPGGYLGRGEQPIDGLRRELGEELGYVLTAGRLLYAETASQRRLLTLYYLVEAEGTFRPSAEIAALQSWPLDALPAGLPDEQRRALAVAAADGLPTSSG
jgi:ADP-ribose pyrophosphatase YjhB (NUDIX family)